MSRISLICYSTVQSVIVNLYTKYEHSTLKGCFEIFDEKCTIQSMTERKSNKYKQITLELQWLEHRWLVYHCYFELVLESQGKNPIATDIYIWDNLM